MTVSAARVEVVVDDLLTAITNLTSSMIHLNEDPLDFTMQTMVQEAKAGIRESIIKLLMLIEVID